MVSLTIQDFAADRVIQFTISQQPSDERDDKVMRFLTSFGTAVSCAVCNVFKRMDDQWKLDNKNLIGKILALPATPDVKLQENIIKINKNVQRFSVVMEALRTGNKAAIIGLFTEDFVKSNGDIVKYIYEEGPLDLKDILIQAESQWKMGQSVSQTPLISNEYTNFGEHVLSYLRTFDLKGRDPEHYVDSLIEIAREISEPLLLNLLRHPFFLEEPVTMLNTLYEIAQLSTQGVSWKKMYVKKEKGSTHGWSIDDQRGIFIRTSRLLGRGISRKVTDVIPLRSLIPAASAATIGNLRDVRAGDKWLVKFKAEKISYVMPPPLTEYSSKTKKKREKLIHTLERMDGTVNSLSGLFRIAAIQHVVRSMFCLLHALRSLHQQDLVHGDVKPDNLFYRIDSRGLLTTYLGDFAGCGNVNTLLMICSPGYFAPEVALNRPRFRTKEHDMFAAGVTLIKLLTGSDLPLHIFLFVDMDIFETYYKSLSYAIYKNYGELILADMQGHRLIVFMGLIKEHILPKRYEGEDLQIANALLDIAQQLLATRPSERMKADAACQEVAKLFTVDMVDIETEKEGTTD